MMHDGSSRSKKASRESAHEDEKLAKTLLRGMIWWWNTHRLNVSLINRIEFRDSKVFTMIVESFTPSSKRELLTTSTKIQDEMKHVTESMTKLLSAECSGDSAAATDLEWLLKCPPDVTDSESYYLAAHGVSQIIKRQDCDIFMASAFILHSTILKNVPISDRRLPLIRFNEEFEEKIEEFIEEISNIFRQTIDRTEWTERMAEREAEGDTTDLVDGRVFRAVIQAMCNKPIEDDLPPSVQSDWTLLLRIVKQLTGQELSLKGSAEPESSESVAAEPEAKSASESPAVLPFSHPVFDKHLECIHVATDTSISAQLGTMKLYRETTHWHNHRKPLNPKAPLAVKVSKWRYVRKLFDSFDPHHTPCPKLKIYLLTIIATPCG